NAKTGDVEVRLASSDPLPDGSCCAPVEYAVSNSVPLSVIPSIAFDPREGPIGSKVVLSGQGFGKSRPEDGRIFFGGKPAIIAQWSDRTIVAHVPLNAQSGFLMLQREGKEREIGTFTVLDSQISGMNPPQGPIGTLVTIKGKNFGLYSEAGKTAYAFDFLSGGNGVEIAGVPAVIHRWLDEQIDVWVPFSAKSGPVIVKRGGAIPKADGTCCERQEIVTLKAGTFTVVQPEIHSYFPKEAGLDEVVTITGKGFGEFLKISEATRLSLNQDAHDWKIYELGQDVSRSEVLVNGVATHIETWTDTEITIRVPRRPAFGFGNPEGFVADLSKGELILKRGSWDMLDTGECCTPKKYISIVAGPFTILHRGLPNKDYWKEKGERSND
ncbi:MAG: IPT/TIG domain-containing protein, partial [Nitrospirota bacterium]